MDIQPRTDLYSWLLFQGVLYQRLQQIDSLDATTCRFHVACAEDAADFGGDIGASLLLGDPYFRDALLQAPQLIVSQDICLPIRIDRLERTRSQGAPASSYTGIAVFEGRMPAGTGPQVRASVCMVDEAGTVVERLTGYQLQIVEHHDEYPTPLQIADPGERDAALLRRDLRQAAAACGVTPPTVALAYLPGLHHLPPEERHRREGPLIAAVVGPLLGEGATLADPPIAWLTSGKPVLAGLAAEIVGVSLAHDDHACLCAVGQGPQGCDLAPVVAWSPADWRALLGPGRTSLLSRLSEGGDALDRAGTRIWAALEAAYKATGAGEIDLALARQEGDAILLRAGTPGGAVAVLTFPLRLLRGPERMVALIVPAGPPPPPAAPGNTAASVAAGLDYNPHSYGMEVTTDGPQGQPVFTLRFPLTFREVSNLSRSLYFSHIFHWMGQVRELACGPVIKELAAQLAGGRWGMVTNMAATQIVGTAHAGDVIEGRLWLDNLSGKYESTMDLGYEWRKIGPDGGPEPVAFSRMRATWVAIHDHGVVETRPLPEYFRQFMYALRPAPAASPPGRALPLDTLESALGPALYRATAGPTNTLLLHEQVFETSLEDANLVGNIYFANYPLWQGRIRDRFFHDLAPGYYHSTGDPGELRCVSSQVDHLREAMPFARILVRMYLGAVHAAGVRLRFDYYRLAPDGSREKLAFGEHTAAWFAPQADGAWRPTQLPAALRAGLLAVATHDQ